MKFSPLYRFLLFALFFPVLTVFTQENERIPTNWTMGETKKVTIEYKTLIFEEEELVNTKKSSVNYRLQVIDTSFRTSIVLQKDSLNFKKDTSMENFSQGLEYFVQVVENKIQSLPYRYIIDRSNGTAFTITNDSIFDQQLDSIIHYTANQFEKTQSTAIDSNFHSNIKHYLQNSKFAIINKLISEVNRIIAPHQFAFNPSKPIEREEVYYSSSFTEQKVEIPVKNSTTVLEDNGLLRLKQKTIYDQETLFNVLKKSEPESFESVAQEEVGFSVKHTATFNRSTNWLIEHTKVETTILPEVEMKSTEKITFH